MSKHNKIGIKGEQIATDFLLNKGYIIIHRNWRSGKRELDIIAEHRDTLVIVEIKTRSRTDMGYPEEAVTKKKQQFLKAATEDFMSAHPQYRNIRFDIISVLMDGGEMVREIVHFEEAFY